MISKELQVIKDAYYEIKDDFNGILNTRESRHKLIVKLENLLNDKLKVYGLQIICDETNNTSEVMDNHQMVARVRWMDANRFNLEVHHVDLVFGDVEIVWE
jgi:hypothetical protein